jgi:hypothetical protein
LASTSPNFPPPQGGIPPKGNPGFISAVARGTTNPAAVTTKSTPNGLSSRRFGDAEHPLEDVRQPGNGADGDQDAVGVDDLPVLGEPVVEDAEDVRGRGLDRGAGCGDASVVARVQGSHAAAAVEVAAAYSAPHRRVLRVGGRVRIVSASIEIASDRWLGDAPVAEHDRRRCVLWVRPVAGGFRDAHAVCAGRRGEFEHAPRLTGLRVRGLGLGDLA